MGEIELEKPGAGAVGCSYFFDGGGPGGGEAIGEVELVSDFGYGEFTEWVVNFVYPDGGEADWGRNFVAKYCRCGVAEIGVDELAGDYSVAEEGLACCRVSSLVRLCMFLNNCLRGSWRKEEGALRFARWV